MREIAVFGGTAHPALAAEIRGHGLCLRRRGCSFVVLAYELPYARRGLPNHVKVMKSASCSRSHRSRMAPTTLNRARRRDV